MPSSICEKLILLLHRELKTKHMKFLHIAFLTLCISGFAQTKVGTEDIDFILSQMPDLTKAQEQVTAYGKRLDTDLDAKLAEYQSLIDAYKAGETTFTEDIKKQKQTELMTMDNDIAKFRQNGTQLIGLKREEVLRPLYAKIGVALETVAKAEAYTQVLQTGNSLIYTDQNYDLTDLILKELGIEVKNEE